MEVWLLPSRLTLLQPLTPWSARSHPHAFPQCAQQEKAIGENGLQSYQRRDAEKVAVRLRGTATLSRRRTLNPTLCFSPHTQHSFIPRPRFHACSVVSSSYHDKLPTKGSRKKLIERHSEFTLLYNAQCDADHPMAMQDIVREVLRRDSRREEAGSGRGQLRGVPRRAGEIYLTTTTSDPGTVNAAQSTYVSAHATHFKQLIRATRDRYQRKLRRPKVCSRSVSCSVSGQGGGNMPLAARKLKNVVLIISSPPAPAPQPGAWIAKHYASREPDTVEPPPRAAFATPPTPATDTSGPSGRSRTPLLFESPTL
jgi:hypothetical protein